MTGVNITTGNSGFIPYSGATGDVALGAYSLAAAKLTASVAVVLPSYTTTQKNALTPAAGWVVFDTTLAKMCVYTGAEWQTVTST